MRLSEMGPTRSPVAQKCGYAFLITVLLAFMQAGFFAAQRADSPEPNAISYPSPTGKPFVAEHPIPKLMADAELNYKKLLSKQSRSLRAAVNEYKKRYKRDPPKGFDKWWEFAKENEVKFIDEYDGLVEDLAPFWEISGEELRRRAYQAGYLPDVHLVRIKDGKSVGVNVHPGSDEGAVSARAVGFSMMIKKFEATLPDMDFPINARSEGRILVPWEHRKYPNITTQNSSGGYESLLGGPFVADWREDGNVWEAYRRICSPTSAARRLFSSFRNSLANQVKNYYTGLAVGRAKDLKFPSSTDAHLDFCTHPHVHTTQGHFYSDWRTVSALFPIFSPAKAKGFLDIKIPSHYYYGSTPRYTYGWDPVNLELKEVDGNELPWENKTDKIFWRGATTGGGSHPPGLSQQYQRHRFVRMASDTSMSSYTITFDDPPGSEHYVSASVPAAHLNSDIMDVAFVKAIGSEHYPGGLEAMMEDHRFGDAVPLGKHWAYKYLMDMDGMSYSGRFLAFLASDSAVLKATVYQEYFSDWIQPWLHFIPISSSYKEIYNVHAYFSGATQSTLEVANSTSVFAQPGKRKSVNGDRRLRRIARAGKQWKKTVGRDVDMEAYVYRLCLEYARLWEDDRDSIGFTL